MAAGGGRGISCAVCKVKVYRQDDHLQCCKCTICVHIKCVNVDIEHFVGMNKDGSCKTWQCGDCLNITSMEISSLAGNVDTDDHAASQRFKGDKTESTPLALRQISHRGCDCGCASKISELARQNSELKKMVELQTDLLLGLKNDFAKFDARMRGAVVADAVGINVADVSVGEGRGPSETNVADDRAPTGLRRDPHSVPGRELGGDDVSGRQNSDYDMSLSSSVQVKKPSRANQHRLMTPTADNARTADDINNRRRGNTVGNTDTAAAASQSERKSEWNLVDGKRNRRSNRTRVVIGQSNKNSASALKTVPKKSYLFVSRLHPDTTCGDIIDFLKPDFPEVECERIESKYATHYASFKVTVSLHKNSRAMDPNLWPEGTYVSRFFLPRKRRPAEPNEA